MAVALNKPYSPTGQSVYGYKPKVVKPKAPTGYAPGGVTYAAPGTTQAATVAPLPAVPKPVISAPTRPEFKSYIAGEIPGDWEVQDAEAALGSRMAGLRDAFQTDIRSQLVNLGMPGNADVSKEFGSYIDQDTITKAVGNKYSAQAQIADQEFKARKQSQAALAARGMLASGATTNQMAGIAAEGEKSRYQAVQDFLSGARGGLKSLGEAKAGLEANVASARANAAARLAQQYGWMFPDRDEDSGMTDAGGQAPVTTGAKAPITVAQAYKALTPAQKKPAPKSPYGYATSYTPTKKKK